METRLQQHPTACTAIRSGGKITNKYSKKKRRRRKRKKKN
jgi:hypothetical protein